MNERKLPEVYKILQLVPKVWGHEEWLWNTEYCAKRIHIRGNHATSWHYHNVKDEIFTVLDGELKVCMSWSNSENDGEVNSVILGPGECLHIPTGLTHRLIAHDGPVNLIECSSHHEDSDSIRVKDGY